ncbi:MAG: hypothetical protein Q8P13_03515 [bacterium]|nr:hypothetical protein [bacterium]
MLDNNVPNPFAKNPNFYTHKVFAAVGLILIGTIIAAAGIWYYVENQAGAKKDSADKATNLQPASSSAHTSTQTEQITWMQTATGWQASGTPPTCPSPVLKTPVALTKVTSILYPGQVRGGNYKPHGGFRFDTAKSSSVSVSAAMDAVVVRGSRYLVNGEIQYTFDFIAPCGIMYRLGHLLVLDSKYQKIAASFPAAKEGDSRTENVNPQVEVNAGETIATAVGITKGGLNVFFDFGVYDLKTKNQASKDAAWAAKPEHDPELAQHALCWFDLLPSTDTSKVKSLPGADGTAGKTSDYCK